MKVLSLSREVSELDLHEIEANHSESMDRGERYNDDSYDEEMRSDCVLYRREHIRTADEVEAIRFADKVDGEDRSTSCAKNNTDR